MYDPFFHELITVQDMPTVEDRSGRRVVDGSTFASKLKPHVENIRHAIIEEVGVMTGKEGTVSMFRFGDSFGTAKGVVSALGIPILLVKPAVWKSSLNLDRDKKKSIALATKRFGSNKLWPLVQNNGRAEAALLALFCSERFK